MNRFSFFPVVMVLLLLSGCMTPPERVDPFADLTSATSPYKDLTLGLVLSQNTKSASRYAQQLDRMRSTLNPGFGEGSAGQKVFENIAALFRRNFKTFIKIETAADAQRINADVVAILDVYTQLPNSNFEDAKIDVSVLFLTTDNKQIDMIRAEGSAAGVVSPFSTPAITVEKASRDVIRKLESAINGSAKLVEFSKQSHDSGTAVAVKPQTLPTGIAPTARVIPSDIDAPFFEATTKLMGENDVAVVIGVEKYQDLPASDFSSLDAKLVKEYLVSLGIRERNIELLLNERATQSSIRKSLESWLPNRVKKDSKVFVYYSGHGAPDPGSGEAYLVPYDGDANYLPTTGYPLKGMYEKLGTLQAAEVVVVLDSCFSGAGGRSVLAKGARPLVFMKEGPALAPNMAVLAATQGAQISTSSSEKRHGVLTYYFLKAIKDGKKDLSEIYSVIKPLVEDEAKLLNVAQTPSLTPDSEKLQGKFRLRK